MIAAMFALVLQAAPDHEQNIQESAVQELLPLESAQDEPALPTSNPLPEIDPNQQADQVESAEPESARQVIVPKAYPMLISIEAELGSKISTARDFFPIRLAQAVVIDGVEVLPADIMGEGQVIHAEKAGFGGSAGELILAARYLMHGDRRIELRSFKFIEEGDEIQFRGRDNSGVVMATAAAIGPLGLLIGGGNTVIEQGTAATAKFRNEEVFEVSSDAVAGPIEVNQDGN